MATTEPDEELVLEKANPKEIICTGCDSHVSRCGPPLWQTQRKCCPDC